MRVTDATERCLGKNSVQSCWATLLSVLALVALPLLSEAALGAAPGLTVPDLIGLTRIGSNMVGGSGGDEHVVSPDGSRVAVVIQKGDVSNNLREFSLLIFFTAELRGHVKPRIAARFSTSSNRPGIAQVVWLSNDVIAFVAEPPDALAQVYTLHLSSEQLVQRTHATGAVTTFKAIDAGATIVYSTEEPPAYTGAFPSLRAHGFVVPPNVPVSDVIAGRWGRIASPTAPQGFLHRVSRGEESTVALPDEGRYGHCMLDGPFAAYADHNLSLSPLGDVALVRCLPNTIPTSWRNLQAGVTGWWIVLDLRIGSARPLTGGPSRQWDRMPTWTPDGRAALLLDDFLPTESVAPGEHSARKDKLVTAEVDIRTGEAHVVPEPRAAGVQSSIEVQEGPAEPWKLVVADHRTRKKRVIYDPNPALTTEHRLAEVTIVNWRALSGAQFSAGLYWPLNYRQHERYPLLIQTHGFRADKFAPDGYSTTGYAAQPLAAAGVFVVQAFECTKECNSPQHVALSEGQQAQEALEGLIDHLDQLGLIDHYKVALQGYSRSCFHQLYFMTHSNYPIATMTCTDGIDESYLQYLLFAQSSPGLATDFEAHDGGPPFGTALKTWMERAPGFNLDRIHAPVQLTALTDGISLLGEWEPFAGLISQGKPAELKYIPEAVHNIVKPWERVASQQNAVDWFRFWLQGYERSVPITAAEETAEDLNDQYARWHKLRERQEASMASIVR